MCFVRLYIFGEGLRLGVAAQAFQQDNKVNDQSTNDFN